MASRSGRIRRRVGLVLAVLLFAVLTWVLPAVYHARYEPATAASAAAAADTAWHPIPTADQDRTYLEQTRTNAPHPGAAVEGRDGYLFLGDDYQANFAQAMGRRFYSRDEVQRTVDAVQARNTWLADRGIAGEIVVVPATSSVYPDKMPAWTDGQLLPTVLDQLIAADPTSFVDLRPDLKAQRVVADTYPRLNSHWSSFGAFVGFQTIVKRLQADHPEIGTLPVPTLAGTTTTDAYNEFAGITGAAGPNDWTVSQFTAPLQPYTLVGGDGSRTTVPGDQLLDLTQMPLQTENPAAGNNDRALILADSATSMMSPYLAAAFGSTYMLRHWMDLPANSPNIPALVESYRPDVVITLISERNLNVVTPETAAWQAAVAYDAGNPQAVGSWATAGGGSSMTVSQPDLSTPMTATLASVPAGGLGIRLDVQAGSAGTLTVSGTGSGGPFSVSSQVAAGTNVLFAKIPAGLVGPTLTIARSDGAGTWNATALGVRALS
ncbi:MAG TPA: hypothetical protein VII33_08145 [Nakamurella sp.]